MNFEDLEYFEGMLLEKHQEILKREGLSGSSIANKSSFESDSGELKYATHLADLGSDTMSEEQKSYLSARLGKFLQHIDEALSRIEKGTYGLCTLCGKKIHRELLEAVPHARYCVPCRLLSGD